MAADARTGARLNREDSKPTCTQIEKAAVQHHGGNQQCRGRRRERVDTVTVGRAEMTGAGGGRRGGKVSWRKFSGDGAVYTVAEVTLASDILMG